MWHAASTWSTARPAGFVRRTRPEVACRIPFRARAGLVCALWLLGSLGSASAGDTSPTDAPGYEELANAIITERQRTLDAERLDGLSFDEQLRLSNLMTVRDQTLEFMDHIEAADAQLRQAETNTVGDLTGRLELGQSLQPGIVESVQGLIEWCQAHNQRINEWATSDEPVPTALAFWNEYKASCGLIRVIRERAYEPAWSYAAIHWYPWAVAHGLDGECIPHDGLALTETAWQTEHLPLSLYAFFSFYRLQGEQSPERLQAWLTHQTGYAEGGGIWNAPLATVDFVRWTNHHFYAYQRVAQLPEPADFLPACFVRLCDGGAQRDEGRSLGELYQMKLDLFKTIVDEVRLACAEGRAMQPYWPLYAFVCRTYPWISAFRLTAEPQTGRGCFVEGYAGDRPALGQFSSDSVMGCCVGLLTDECLREAGADLVRQVLDPVVLLAQRDLAETGPGAAPAFTDPKVGFEGYLRYYDELLGASWPATSQAEHEEASR